MEFVVNENVGIHNPYPPPRCTVSLIKSVSVVIQLEAKALSLLTYPNIVPPFRNENVLF